MKNELKHLKVITKHKYLVTKYCFKAGLYMQGIKHDLSKYGPTEFLSSAKYFQGGSSPINAEKVDRGYSIAWQHHKGHNPHHWEYWLDWVKGRQIMIRIPENYAYEFVCDYIGAGMSYAAGRWTQDMPEKYYTDTLYMMKIHSETNTLLLAIFKDITEYGPDYACAKMKKKEYRYSDSGNFTEFVI